MDTAACTAAIDQHGQVIDVLLSAHATWPRPGGSHLAGMLRREFPDRSLILGEAHPRAVPAEYQEHDNAARPYQGTSQRIPDIAHHPPLVIAGDFRIRQIRRKPVLSGLINEYERAA